MVTYNYAKNRVQRNGKSTSVAVKMHSPKKVLPSTYFRGNKYSPAYISQVKITPGITFFLGNNYSFGKESTPLHSHNFLHIIFFPKA